MRRSRGSQRGRGPRTYEPAPQASPVMSVTSFDGTVIAVHPLGGPVPQQRSAGAVVFVHPAGLHGRMWAPVAAGLGPQVVAMAPDLRGHGDSDPPPGRDLDWGDLARDVLAVVDGLGLVRPFAVGLSSGATALLLAEQARPGQFRALYCYEPVIVAADPPLGRDPDNWLAQQARSRRARFTSRAAALAHFSRRAPLADLDPAVLRSYVEHGLHDTDEGDLVLACDPVHEALVYETATAHDAFAHLHQVGCPVTLASGGCSEVLTPDHAAAIARRLPHVQVEVAPILGHLGPLQDPVAGAAAIRRTLAGAPPS